MADKVWNPTGGPNGTGAWEDPPNQGPNYSFTGPPPTAPPPRGGGPDAGGYSNADGGAYDGTATHNGSYDTGGASLGKVRPFGGAGAWGGYTGTMVDDGNGGVRYDAGLSGRQEAVDRARGLGEAAANQKAVQIDYGRADQFAGLGQQDRGFTTDAMNLTRQTALGQNLQSQRLGQQMLQQGVQAQQAAAASTRGGPLAQAAAMRQQAAGQGAFMQAGNTQLEAQRAAEMAQGREQYMGQATGLRAIDAQAQGLNQQQGINQMNQELGQRGLNQQGQMGYEAQGQAINKGAADAAMKAKEMQAGIDSAASLRAQKQADREMQTGASGASAGGALIAKVGEGFNTPTPAPGGGTPGGAPGEARPYDPYSDDVSNSDMRTKTKVTSLASAALMRGRR